MKALPVLLGLMLLSSRLLAVELTEGVSSAGSSPSAHPENGSVQKDSQGEIVILVRGLRNSEGQLLIALFEQPDGFPDEHEKALRTKILPLDGEPLQIRFRSIAPGRYAVAVVHDENENERLDTNLVGIPREGVGVSGGKNRMLRKPTFHDADFLFTDEEKQLVIEMIYF